jgi:5-methylcytosine-specific restriction protein A
MLKICSYPSCNVPVEIEHFDRQSPRCNAHPLEAKPKKLYAHHHDEAGKNIYHSWQWKKLRKLKASKDPLCEHCKRYGIYEPLAVVDHVKELADGGEPYDINNLQSLCHSCHNRKTAVERRKRESTSEFGSMNDF